MVQRIMNTVEKTATGVAPAQLILNNSVRLSSQILQSQRVMHPPDTTSPSGQVALSDRMDEWISRQSALITVVRDKQSKTDFHALVEYDPAITEYPINSYVLFTPPVGRSDKLLPRHRGPYQVIKKKTSSIYTIENLGDGKRSTTHIYNLRPFNYDPARTLPLVVAQHIAVIGPSEALWSSKCVGQDLENLVTIQSPPARRQASSIPPGKQDEDPHPGRT